MREGPPPQLKSLLEGLGLATTAEFDRAEPHVRRLARDLPRFESLWIDALAQARVLTPWQAVEINAGRGQRLRVGPYLLCQPAQGCHYANCYRARQTESREAVRLIVAEGGLATENTLRQLEALTATSPNLPEDCFAPVLGCGLDGDRIWAASRWIEGPTAAEWLIHHGRFSGEAVLEIARTMLAGLTTLESQGLCHGDLGTSASMLTSRGEVVLLQPGLRGILRPEEGYAHADLRPEAYEGLAPERISAGTPPNIASDIFACGCLWWHLLCGRSPLPGGDSQGKLRAAQTARIEDVRRLAPEVPKALAEAIAACVQREPSERPPTMAQLAAMLGPRCRAGRQTLVRSLAGASRPIAPWVKVDRPGRRSSRTPRMLTAAAVGLMALIAVVWPIWSAKTRRESSNVVGTGHHAGMVGVPDWHAEHKAASVPSSRRDPSVVPANYESPAAPSEAGGDLVLQSDGPVSAETLVFKPGQRVRAERGKRAALAVPRRGLVVGAENVRFENIDFVGNRSDKPGQSQPAAIVQLRASRAEFHSCSFLGRTDLEIHSTSGILWTHPADAAQAATSLPSGRVRIINCLFRRVDAALDCRTVGALGIELVNCLHVGRGPLVRLDHAPAADEPVRITVAQVTLRNAEAMLECRCGRMEGSPGEIAIEATGCVLAPGAALLLLAADASPEPLLRGIRWAGQGSLVTPEPGIAVWRRANGTRQTLDDSLLSFAGLVRSTVAFAGSADGPPAASRLLRWQAPLQSGDTPGVDVEMLMGHDVGQGAAAPAMTRQP